MTELLIQNKTPIEKKDLAFLFKDKHKLPTQVINEIINNFDNNKIDDCLMPLENLNKKGELNISKSTLNEIKNDIKLLEKNYPLAYIIGYVDFINAKIDLSFRPLIPRAETEFWVNKAIHEIDKNFKKNKKPEPAKILDIFAGSGCIGIAILKNIRNAHVTFTDIDPNAINQIEKNLELNEINHNKYKIIESDIFENIKNDFDYIFANPPYVDKNDRYEKSIEFEPSIAIFTKKGKFSISERFLNSASKFLRPKGKIYMEFGDNQSQSIEKILIKNKLKNFKIEIDQFKKSRWITISQ